MSGVLVDTSVWIAHFRHRNVALEVLLQQDQALTHPMVIGELACGTPPAPRAQTRWAILICCLWHSKRVCAKRWRLSKRESLYGMGCGLIDMVLLASTLMTPGATLWTLDKRLAELARRYGVLHRGSSLKQAK